MSSPSSPTSEIVSPGISPISFQILSSARTSIIATSTPISWPFGRRTGRDTGMSSAPFRRPWIGRLRTTSKAQAVEVDAEIVAVGQVAIHQRLGVGHRRHDLAFGIAGQKIGQQIGGNLVLGAVQGEVAGVAVRVDLVLRLVQCVLDHEQRRAELVGDGLGELLDMRLARSARGVVELAQHQVGEGHDEQHDGDADQADDLPLALRGGQSSRTIHRGMTARNDAIRLPRRRTRAPTDGSAATYV